MTRRGLWRHGMRAWQSSRLFGGTWGVCRGDRFGVGAGDAKCEAETEKQEVAHVSSHLGEATVVGVAVPVLGGVSCWRVSLKPTTKALRSTPAMAVQTSSFGLLRFPWMGMMVDTAFRPGTRSESSTTPVSAS